MNQQATEDASFGKTSVLVPMDFTADSEAALVWACRYTEKLDVNVKVLHIIHDPGDAPGAYHQSEEDLMKTSAGFIDCAGRLPKHNGLRCRYKSYTLQESRFG